jgi:hypothetical protein
VHRRADGGQAAAAVGVGGGEQDADVPAPGVAQPIHRFVDAEVVQYVERDADAVLEAEPVRHGRVVAVGGAVDQQQPARGG